MPEVLRISREAAMFYCFRQRSYKRLRSKCAVISCLSFHISWSESTCVKVTMNANSDDSDSGDERRNSVEPDINRDQPRNAGILHRSFKPTFIVCRSVNLMSMCADPRPPDFLATQD